MEILIVEDEAGIADFLERGLRAEGYEVKVARDGEEGPGWGSTPRSTWSCSTGCCRGSTGSRSSTGCDGRGRCCR